MLRQGIMNRLLQIRPIQEGIRRIKMFQLLASSRLEGDVVVGVEWGVFFFFSEEGVDRREGLGCPVPSVEADTLEVGADGEDLSVEAEELGEAREGLEHVAMLFIEFTVESLDVDFGFESTIVINVIAVVLIIIIFGVGVFLIRRRSICQW